MIAHLLSFSRIGSYKNPIWHIGAIAEVVSETAPLPTFHETTIIAYETLTDKRLNELSKLDYLSKSHIVIQLHLEQIDCLKLIQDTKIKAQVWVDQKLSQQTLSELIKFREFIDLVFVPMGQFDCQKEIETILKTKDFSCRMLLIPKKSIHDPFPTADNYYYWLEELNNNNLKIKKLIIKGHFEECSLSLQNLFLNFNHQNMMKLAKDQGPTHYIVFSVAQILNTITFNYFSNVLLNIMKPSKPTFFRALYYDTLQIYYDTLQIYYDTKHIKDVLLQNERQARNVIWTLMVNIYFHIILKAYHFMTLQAFQYVTHKIILFFIFTSWPIRKVYWTLKFQIEKRLLGRHKNEF